MLLSQALDAVHKFSPHEFVALADLLSPELINECLADAGVVTLRKRRLSMEMMVWAITGMVLFHSHSMSQIVSHMDILLPGHRSFVAPSAVVQARQRLGENILRLMRAVKKRPQRYALRPHSKALLASTRRGGRVSGERKLSAASGADGSRG